MIRFLRLALLAMQFGCLRRYGAVILSRILSDRAYDETSDIAFRQQFTAGMRGRGKLHCDALDAGGPDCGFKSCLGGRIRIDGAALREWSEREIQQGLEYIERPLPNKKSVSDFSDTLCYSPAAMRHMLLCLAGMFARTVSVGGSLWGIRSRCRESRTATHPKEPSRPLPRLFSCPAGLWR